MCKGLVAKKLGMTSMFGPNGQYIPVTVLQVGPCVVTQIKKDETDGYKALQLGFGVKKEKNTNKPLKGHFKKSRRHLLRNTQRSRSGQSGRLHPGSAYRS